MEKLGYAAEKVRGKKQGGDGAEAAADKAKAAKKPGDEARSRKSEKAKTSDKANRGEKEADDEDE
jgi:hypothetical protein